MCRSARLWWGPLIPAGGAPRAGSPRPASAPASSATASAFAMYPLAAARQPEARKPARRLRCPALAAAAAVGCLVLVSFAVVAFTLSRVLDVRPFQEAARSTESALLEEAAIVAEVAGPPPGAGSTNGSRSAVHSAGNAGALAARDNGGPARLSPVCTHARDHTAASATRMRLRCPCPEAARGARQKCAGPVLAQLWRRGVCSRAVTSR
ncbi:translation initiation factor IF-2-like [Schistocerca nitens]|uniref:translation initiation factor IF-2-like n=1 Tax=Schistocerca nitens TaxID=7011 RepID=UPI0021192952|nr:translation initiation factor IF-2-like [Schistocerca nitens]